MIGKMTTPWSLLLLACLTLTAHGQFSCTLTATDEDGCLTTSADDGGHCVWCAVSAYGFCVSETQAESMEANLPSVECDRYSGSDDDATPAADDDATPTTDDETPTPTDDALPPNYWECLEKKTSAACASDGCTWCDSKGGFGLCMTGPSATMAEDSDWFTCTKSLDMLEDIEAAAVTDPYDPTCVMAFLQDPTEEGCTAAADPSGDACLWCTLPGMGNVCLSTEQADMGSQLGITCEAVPQAAVVKTTTKQLRGSVQDPYDPSCIMAFLQDPSEEGCTAAMDAEGGACEYCSFQGSMNICLTEEQAEMGEQMGIECGSAAAVADVADPYDPSCALAFLQDMTPESCQDAVDAEGNPCEYCSLQGALNLCLTGEQAQVGQSGGIDCDDTAMAAVVDPYDPSCAVAFLQDQSEESCKSAVDSDGQPCEFCSLQGTYQLCLNQEQAAMGEQLGIECDASVSMEEEDAEVTLPDDFWDCLQNYDEDGCAENSCTWCNTEVGMGFCLADAVADTTHECTFFDCDFKKEVVEESIEESVEKTVPKDPLDPACMAAGMGSDDAESVCVDTMDSVGSPCVWCNAAGVFGLCLSSDQATAASAYLACDGATLVLEA